MMRGVFSIAALLAFALIQGCSTAPKKPLDRTDIDRLESIKLVVIIPGEMLEADVESSNISTYTGGGLIFFMPVNRTACTIQLPCRR
ncbi:MAG: hypothetical protein ACC707_16460, partial [Thiohalomonadales bacterium]